MLTTYQALKKKDRDALLSDWESLHPSPPYYPFRPRLTPHPFMGLNKFTAGRIHQMRAGKSYLAAHPSWWNESPNHTCPRCGSAPETFAHAILHCPQKERDRSLLLGEVTSLGEGSPLWSSSQLIQALGHFITATYTGFPPDMLPQDFLLSPRSSPSPQPPTYD